MAAAVIDRRRVLLLFQHLLLSTSGITTKCDVKRTHEAETDGNPRPCIKIIGTSRFQSPHRRGGGLSGAETDMGEGAFALVVKDRVEGQGDQQMGAEDALSLLRKHCTERRIDGTVTQGSGANQMTASGHTIELLGMRDEMDYDPTDTLTRVFNVEIDFFVHRATDVNNGGNGLLIEA